MTARAVIPPLTVDNMPEKQTYDILQTRLQSAEADTRQLLEHIKGMGFDTTNNAMDSAEKPYSPVTPFRGQVNQSNYETFKNNYETLVSRVCKMESVLQSLKLNLVNLQGGTNLGKKQEAEYREKFQLAREAYEQEIGKLTRQVEYLKDEVETESDARAKARQEIQELQKVLSQASDSRMEATMTAEGLSVSQQKLQKRITDLKEEVSREQSLRASLEESHNTLLARVHEMEKLVENERNGVKNMSQEFSQMKTESEVLRDQLKDETRKKQVAESSYKMLSEEKGYQKVSMKKQVTESSYKMLSEEKDKVFSDKDETRKKQVAESTYKMLSEEKDSLEMKYSTAESDRQLLVTELTRLREQYEDLIKQMEQTQAIIDKQQNKNKELVAENENLQQVLRNTAAEHDKLTTQLKRELESERKKSRDKESIEDDALRLKDSVAELTNENISYKKKIKRAEEEVERLRSRINDKDEEFTKTANSLQRELETLKDQLQEQQREKDKLIKDKENLLEEVNQTVDSMVSERTKLQKNVQQQQLDLDSHSRARRKLEHENAQLLERVAGFEQQQQAQKHVENTLKEMMDQKNKLAYDNGRLQTQFEQATIELESLRKADLEVTHYKQLVETLTSKYSQSETEISELKVTIQRQDSQLKQMSSTLDTRHSDYATANIAKDELMKENQRLLTKLQSTEEREKRKVKALQKNNEDAKSVNKEIASTLESVMASHSQLQSVVESLQTELGKKDSQINRLKNDKNREQQEWKTEMKRFEERMDNVKEELKKEREVSQRKTTRDIGEIRKQNDSLSTRNMDLMKANTDLRQKNREQETTMAEMKEKMADQRRKIEYLHRAKKDTEENISKMKEMKSDIEELENLRDTYIAKNQEQADMISAFMAQINSLQLELRQLAHAQNQTHDLVAQRERSIEKERKLKDDIRRKYKESKKREDELESMKLEAERRLNEVKDESLEISSHLKSAHEWFKDKFDNLQHELLASRVVQEKLEEQNTDQKKKLDSERRKAQVAAEKAREMIKLEDQNTDQKKKLDLERHKSQASAEKAREMIKASRQTISRLSDYADLADQETKQQLNQLYSQLQNEKDHSKYMELKHKRYKDSAERQFEDLLRETENSYS